MFYSDVTWKMMERMQYCD